MARNKKNETQKNRAERHHAAGNDRQKKTLKFPALKRIFNLQGLIFERGAIFSTPQLDHKSRDALCHRLMKFKAELVTRRMNELFHKLYVHRESLREETGRYED